MATTQTKQMTARERAIAKAKEVEPYCQRLNTYSWCVNGMLDGVRYIVTLPPGGELEGARCTCQGAEHPYCYHRASAFLHFQDWRWTEQGQAWEAEYFCSECHVLPKAGEHTDYCHRCNARIRFNDLLANLPDFGGKTVEQVLEDEKELYG